MINFSRLKSQITLLIVSFFCSMVAQSENLPINETSGFLDLANGQRLHYLAKGEQYQKPLLLFIHGAPERAEVWEDYMRYFSVNYFTVAYTTRGYYPSSIPQDVDAYSTDLLAEDAIAVAEAFGYDTFTIVAHDWGGSVAWRAAMSYPDAVERLVIMSNPHPIMYSRAYYESQDHKDLIDSYIPLAREGIAPWTREATLSNNLAHFKNDVYTGNSKDAIDWSLGIALETTWLYEEGASIDAIYNHYKALDWPLTTLNTCEPAPSISLAVNQPVALFYGEDDPFVSAEAYTLPDNDCNTNTWYVSFPRGGHFINHTHKKAIIMKMEYFLNSTEN